MQADYFRHCDKAHRTVFISECERCKDTECPKNIPDKPWEAVSYEKYVMGVDMAKGESQTEIGAKRVPKD